MQLGDPWRCSAPRTAQPLQTGEPGNMLGGNEFAEIDRFYRNDPDRSGNGFRFPMQDIRRQNLDLSTFAPHSATSMIFCC
jgi:hypothetical protein